MDMDDYEKERKILTAKANKVKKEKKIVSVFFLLRREPKVRLGLGG
jgi:hypothetical protein